MPTFTMEDTAVSFASRSICRSRLQPRQFPSRHPSSTPASASASRFELASRLHDTLRINCADPVLVWPFPPQKAYLIRSVAKRMSHDARTHAPAARTALHMEALSENTRRPSPGMLSDH